MKKNKRLIAWIEWAMETEWKKDEKKPGVILFDGGKIEVSAEHRDGILLMHDALVQLGKLFGAWGNMIPHEDPAGPCQNEE